MGHIETFLVFAIFLCAVSDKGFGQQTIAIDTADDIPNDGRFEVNCPNGYANYSTEFDCGEFGGTINIPPERLNGEIGFWTKCGRTCVIRYHAKPEDFHLKIRVYQSGTMLTGVRIGDKLIPVLGQGWVIYSRNLNLDEDTNISISLGHMEPTVFVALDKLIINGESGPSSTTASSS